MIQYIIKMVKYDYKINDKIWNTTDDLLKTNMRISISGTYIIPCKRKKINAIINILFLIYKIIVVIYFRWVTFDFAISN
jgi:hypothetical protein